MHTIWRQLSRAELKFLILSRFFQSVSPARQFIGAKEESCFTLKIAKLGFVSMSGDEKVLTPRESGTFITRHAKHVKIEEEGVQKLSDEIYQALKSGELKAANFSQVELHPQNADESAVDWIFLIDTLNFCFWSPKDYKEKWQITFHGKSYTGYFALCAAVNRAIEEGVAITDPKYYSQITSADLKHILRSDTSTPVSLLEERVKCLHEVGSILLKKYNGSFVNCVKESEGSAQKLLSIITENFSCFKDEADFAGQQVALFKRAQILIGDVWACFEGKGLGDFVDIDSITMFADYRIPQVLVHFGAMKYTPELLSKLETGNLLTNGSQEEVEIRGCSIEVIEKVCCATKKRIAEANDDLHVNSILIDHFLWDYRRKHAEKLEVIPFHRVHCIYY